MNLKKLIHSYTFLNEYRFFLQSILVAIFGLAILSLSNLADQKQIISYSSDKLQFNSQTAIGPVSLINQKKSALLVEAKINLNFINRDPSFSYGNLFQTSSRLDGIRFELQPQNKLVLITGEGYLYLVTENLKSNHSYNIEFQYFRQKNIQVSVDGSVVLDIRDPKITGLKFYLQNFVVGSGYSLSRPFNGEINNFEASIQYSKPTLLATLSTWALLPITFLAFFLLYLKISNYAIPSLKSLFQIPICQQQSNDIYLYPLTIISSTVLIWAALLIGERHLGIAKWLPYLFIPFFLFLLGLLKFKSFKNNLLKWILVLLSLVILSGFLLASISKTSELNRYLLLFFTLTATIVLVSPTQYRLVTVFISLISWLTIYPLLNWRLISGFLEDSPFPFLIYASITIVVIGWFINGKKSSLTKNHAVIRWVFLVIALSIFFYLSFRTDTLFIPGSEYHWEYFVGPIRTIRNGGWLLYDAPSQYGFLNILLASLLPISSSWQSFYIFQSSILFITSSAVLILLFSISNNNFSSKVFLFLLVMGSFFFADPAWIGPTPYPSSSVTRFFSCYLLLCLSFIPKQYRYRVLLISMGWLIGALWSAESCLYSTVIYFFYIAADVAGCKSWKDVKIVIFKYLIYSFALLTATLVIIAIYYKIKLGHLPDFLSHFDYAMGYASGYGYVPFPLNGPGNIMLLIFLGIGLLTLASLRTPAYGTMTASLACAAGCIWAIGSYYLGRPVPQNITAMFPLLTTCSLIGLLQAKRINHNLPYGPLSAAVFPVLFLILSTFYINSFWQKSVTFKSFNKDISTNLFHKSDELSNAIEQIDPKGMMPRVYLGDSAVSPKLNMDLSERTWLPTPLQLVMPPISQNRKEQILNRYLCSNPHDQVILIHQPGSVSSELPALNLIFNNYFYLESTKKIGPYELLFYIKKPDLACKND